MMTHIAVSAADILNNPEYSGLTTADLNVSPADMARVVARLECLLDFDESTPAARRQVARDDLAEDAQFFVAVAGSLDELGLWLDAEDVAAFWLTKITGSEEWKDKAIHAALVGAMLLPMPRLVRN